MDMNYTKYIVYLKGLQNIVSCIEHSTAQPKLVELTHSYNPPSVQSAGIVRPCVCFTDDLISALQCVPGPASGAIPANFVSEIKDFVKFLEKSLLQEKTSYRFLASTAIRQKTLFIGQLCTK